MHFTCTSHRNSVCPNGTAPMSTVQQQTCYCWRIDQLVGRRMASSQTSPCGEGVGTSRFLGSHILKKHTTDKRALGRGFVTHGTDRLLRRRVRPSTRHSSLHKNGDLTILNYMYASILRSKRIVQSREYGYINISFRVPVCILM